MLKIKTIFKIYSFVSSQWTYKYKFFKNKLIYKRKHFWKNWKSMKMKSAKITNESKSLQFNKRRIKSFIFFYAFSDFNTSALNHIKSRHHFFRVAHDIFNSINNCNVCCSHQLRFFINIFRFSLCLKTIVFLILFFRFVQ